MIWAHSAPNSSDVGTTMAASIRLPWLLALHRLDTWLHRLREYMLVLARHFHSLSHLLPIHIRQLQHTRAVSLCLDSEVLLVLLDQWRRLPDLDQAMRNIACLKDM